MQATGSPEMAVRCCKTSLSLQNQNSKVRKSERLNIRARKIFFSWRSSGAHIEMEPTAGTGKPRDHARYRYR